MLPKNTIITTSRCVLRVPDESDFDMIFSATRYEGFNEGMQWNPPQSIDELNTPLNNALIRWENGEEYTFTIHSKGDDPIKYGRISIRITEIEGQWNIGYWIHPEYQGKGMATECIDGIVNFGFKTLNARSISAHVTTWNKASEKALIKNGFKFSHHIPQGIKKRGEWVAENGFSLSSSSWEKHQVNNEESSFSEILKDNPNTIYEDDYFVILLDIDPISMGHVIICPKEHYRDFHDLPQQLAKEMILLAQKYCMVLQKIFDCEGYSLMLNAGNFNDLKHCHIHVFPRYSIHDFQWTYDDEKVPEEARNFELLKKLIKGHI